MYPSRYAHLPTKEYDYKYILDNIEDEMLLKEVDLIIAKLKNKSTVGYHYRSNLKSLGLFTEEKNVIKLNENVLMYKNRLLTLRQLLKFVIEENEDIMYIYDLIIRNEKENFDLKYIALLINKELPNRKYDDIIRWIRPISFLFKYVYEQEMDHIGKKSFKEILKIIQQEYFKFAKELGEPVAIELINNNIMKLYPDINLHEAWEKIYMDKALEYKVSFMTFPSWAANNKPININKEIFTHIKIKKYIDRGVN